MAKVLDKVGSEVFAGIIASNALDSLPLYREASVYDVDVLNDGILKFGLPSYHDDV